MMEHDELTGGENPECCLNLSQRNSMSLCCWCCCVTITDMGWIWLQAWPCWRYIGTDWVKCGGEVLWRSRRLHPVFPICGCSQAVWWVGWAALAHRRCRAITWRLMFHRNTETVMDTWLWKERDGVSHTASYGVNAFDNQSLDLKQLEGSLWCHLDSLNVLLEKRCDPTC